MVVKISTIANKKNKQKTLLGYIIYYMLSNILNNNWFSKRDNNMVTTTTSTDSTLLANTLTIDGNTFNVPQTGTYKLTCINSSYEYCLKYHDIHYNVNEFARTVSIKFVKEYTYGDAEGGTYTVNAVYLSSSSSKEHGTDILSFKDFFCKGKENNDYEIGKNAMSKMILSFIQDNYPEELV